MTREIIISNKVKWSRKVELSVHDWVGETVNEIGGDIIGYLVKSVRQELGKPIC